MKKDEPRSEREAEEEFDKLPSVDDLLAEAEADDWGDVAEQSYLEAGYDESFEAESVSIETSYAHLEGIRDHYDNKKGWSKFLMLLLGAMIVFQWLLLGMVGFGWWDFTQYEWLLPVLLVQNLGQIIGLALVVVRSLFKDITPKG